MNFGGGGASSSSAGMNGADEARVMEEVRRSRRPPEPHGRPDRQGRTRPPASAARCPQVQATLRMQYVQEFYQVRRPPSHAPPARHGALVCASQQSARALGAPPPAAPPATAPRDLTPAPLPPATPQTVRDKCFKVCVTSPGSSLSSSEQKCISRCMDRYQDVSGATLAAPSVHTRLLGTCTGTGTYN